MSRYLLDTDWLIDFLIGRAAALDLVRPLLAQGLAISVITYAEFYEGLVRSPDRIKLEQKLDDFVSGTEMLPIDVDTAHLFGERRAELRSQGKLIDNFDLLIAATALRNDLTLVTRNVRDFQRIEGLQLYQDAS